MSDRLPRARASLAGFQPYRTQQQPAEVRLHANEWGDPTALAEYLTPGDLADTSLNRYPDQNAALLRARLATELGVAADQLVLGNGSNEVLLYTFLLYGGADRTLLVFTPTYSMYGRLATLTGMRARKDVVGLPYALDAERVRRAIAEHAPDLVVLCSPNNPTGTLIDEQTVVAALEAAPDACVVVDEAYADFSGRTVIPLIARHPNLVVARTFSKARAAAGLRLGALVADARVAAVYDAARLPYNVGAVTQRIALRVLEHGGAVAARTAHAARERERIIAALRAHTVLEVYDSASNFVLFRQPGRTAAALHAALLGDGVLVRDVSGWPDAGESLRVTIGTTPENDRFLAAIGRILANDGGGR